MINRTENVFALVIDDNGIIEEVTSPYYIKEYIKEGDNLLHFIDSQSHTKYKDFLSNLKKVDYVLEYDLIFKIEKHLLNLRINGYKREGRFYIMALYKDAKDIAILCAIVQMNSEYTDQMQLSLRNIDLNLQKDRIDYFKKLNLDKEYDNKIDNNIKVIEHQYKKQFMYLKLLEDMVIKDSLTGAYNQIYFYQIIQKELEKVQKYNKNAVMIYVDFDKFSRVNDILGYETGDRLLKEFVNTCTMYFRDKKDTIFRLEGDEFVILCQEQDIHTAQKTISMVCDEFKKLINISELSYGLIEICPKDVEKRIKIETYLKQAHQKLYYHKNSKKKIKIT